MKSLLHLRFASCLSVTNTEEHQFSSWSQETTVSATLVEQYLYPMKSSCPPGDLRWNTLLAPNTESAASLRQIKHVSGFRHFTIEIKGKV